MFDTAGLRRRARVEDDLEKLAGADALRAAKFAEVVVLLLDAAIPFEKQDLTLADLAEREGRALVIGLNKWDLIESQGRQRLPGCARKRQRLLPQVKGAPVMPVSGATGEGDRATHGGGFPRLMKFGTNGFRRRGSIAGSARRLTRPRRPRSRDGASKSAT